MIRRALGVAGLAVLVLAGIALFRPSAPPPGGGLTTPGGSDYYMLDATVTQFGQQGRREYRLSAQRFLHFPDDSARLTGIRGHYWADKQGKWTLTARRGKIPPDSRDLLLIGDVTLSRPAAFGTPITVHTSRVWLRTNPDVVETRADVTARSPDRYLHSGGMTINLQQDTLTLHHNVRAVYTP